MGRNIAALLKMVEQHGSGCIISVFSPGAGEDTSCNNSDQQGVYSLGWMRPLTQTWKESIAWPVTQRTVRAQNDQAALAVFQIQPPCRSPQYRAKEFSSKFIGVSRVSYSVQLVGRSSFKKRVVFISNQDHALQHYLEDYLEALLMLQHVKQRHCAHFTCTF